MVTPILIYGSVSVVTLILIIALVKGSFIRRFKATRLIKFELNTSLIYVQRALKNAGFKKIKFYQTENWFKAETKPSILLLNEKIMVRVRGDENYTVIYFYSTSTLLRQIISFGKNKRNYKCFLRELKKLKQGVLDAREQRTPSLL